MKLKGRDIELSKNQVGDLVIIVLYTSEICNLRCKYCFEDVKKPHRDELTLGEKLGVIDQAAALGSKILVIPGAGEPMMDPHFGRIIKHAHDYGMTSVVYTNGTFINDKNARFMFENDVTPIVKLESLDENVHDYLTGVKGSHKQAIEALDCLIKAGYNGDSEETRLGVAAVYTNQNIRGLSKLKDWCEKRHIRMFVDVLGIYGSAVKYEDELKPTKIEIEQKQKNLGAESSHLSDNICAFWGYGITIDQIGEARYCTEIKTDKVGNIRDHTLKELIEIKNSKYPARPGGFTCPFKKGSY